MTTAAVVVMGEALIDAHHAPGRLSLHPGGGPFSTAVALARLGVPVALAGAISGDRLGDELRARLASACVDTSLVLEADAPTPLAVVTTAGGEAEYSFYLAGTAHERLDPGRIGGLGSAAALHVGTLALATDPPGASVAAFAEREAGRRALVLDPNVRPALISDRDAYLERLERLVSVAELAKLSEADLAWLAPGSEPAEAARHLLDAGAGCVVVTAGADGASGWTASAAAAARAPSVAVADTIGAGDAFGAGFIAWLWRVGRLRRGGARSLAGGELAEALRYAVAAGAAQCTRASAWGPSRADVEALLESGSDDRREEEEWQSSSTTA